MFVRWEQRSLERRRRSGAELPGVIHIARLMESPRDAGQPGQRVVAYLGSIRERERESAICQWWFWRDIASKLDALNLASEERARIEAQLVAVVPQPTEEEAEAAYQAALAKARQSGARHRP